MKNKLINLILILSFALAACSSPTPVATESAAPDAPTATSAPTETAAPTNTPTEVPPTATPEPTATATPAPQPISAANIANLTKTGVIEIPRQPNLVLDPNLSGIFGNYTSDSQHIVLRTDAGVDVISPTTLEVEKQYPGLQLVNVLNDGRFAALQGGALVFVEPLSGETETVETEANLSGPFAVSPTGEQVAGVVDSKTARLYSLTGGEPLDIPIKNSILPGKITFTGDGANVVLDYISRQSTSHFEVYETTTATKLYDYLTYDPPQLSADGKYFTARSISGQSVVETATNKVLNVYNPGHIIERGCDFNANVCVDHGVGLWGVFMIGSPETAITVIVETRSEGKPGNSVAEQGWHDVFKNESTFITDIITGVQKFVFSGYSIASLQGGLGAPDGSTFVIIDKNAGLFVHSLTDGTLVVQTDRYSVGASPQLSPDGSQVGWSNLKGVYVYDWQKAELVLEQSQPVPISQSALLGFLPDGRLLVESTPGAGVGLDVWNIAGGNIEKTVSGLGDCSADAVGAYVLCTVPSSGARRIVAVDNPDRIVFNTTDPNITVISPTGDSYATCKPGGGSITFKNYESGNVTIAHPCQPMFYRPDGLALVLQSGVVVDLPSGESTLALEAGASGQAFSGDSPAAFFGPDFIIVGNRAFDSASGKLLGELPVSGALGFVLSEDGFTLNVLTGSGMEQWQVVQ